jgi:DMSO/TMAO reductase YedYZ molybdopterin-dependent catalytic subunit
MTTRRVGARLRARVVSRRSVLAGAAAMGALAACGDTGGKDTGADASMPEPIEPITPNDRFYVTSCCGTPEVDAATWALVIKALGVEVARIDLATLEALPSRDKEHTLECISAGSYHHAIGNGVWTGVPLTELFAALGVTAPESAIELKFTSADDYSTSIPVGDLSSVWIVWRLNGEPLPAEHGFPARLLVPGRYGMKNPKWLTEIDLSDTPHIGFWESRGWSNSAYYLPNTLILRPERTAAIVDAGPVRVLGTAFAGSDPVVRVEVRVNGGEWADAVIDYAPGADIWTLWHADFELEVGVHVVQARCTTASGAQSLLSDEPTEYLDGFDGSMELSIEAV